MTSIQHTAPLSTVASATVILICAVTVTSELSASPILLTPDDRFVCCVNQDSGSVSLWEWASENKPIEIPVGDEPRMLALVPGSDLLCVTTQRSQQLALVELSTATCISEIPVSGQPAGVVVTPDGRYAFVAQFAGDYIDGEYHSGSVAVVNLESRQIETRIPTRASPFAVTQSTNGRYLYVTHYYQTGNSGWVSEIDISRRRVTREFEFPEESHDASGKRGVFNALTSLAVHPQQRRLLTAGMHANIRRGLSQSGRPLSHKTTVQAAVRMVDLDAGQEIEGARMISSFSGQAVAVPSAVAFLPDGSHFIDVYFASNDLKILAYNERGLVAERALLELPAGPSGIAITSDGRHAFVNCRWERCVAQVRLTDIRRPKVVSRQSVTEEPWQNEQILGARIFHNTRDPRMTPNRWLSCGVCHLDGGILADNLQWEFSKEQKPSSPSIVNTKSLAVAAQSGPPWLIQGRYRTIHEEDGFVRSFLRGTGFGTQQDEHGSVPESRELDALSSFVLSLRPRPNPHMKDGLPRDEIRASATRGSAVFHSEKTGCSSCHQGRSMTISGLEQPAEMVNVGTGISADVPSLINVWATAPYLHDGRATLLRDVVTTFNPDDRHGATSHLSDTEVDDLVSFLLAPWFEATE